MDKYLSDIMELHIYNIFNILHDKKNELMNLEYANDNCCTYFEDDVWDIFNTLSASIKGNLKILEQVMADVKEGDQ